MAKRKHYDLIIEWANDDKIEIEQENMLSGKWDKITLPCFHPDLEYRKATTKPSIDWSHVAPEFKWMATDSATDSDGWTYLYSDEPHILPDAARWDSYAHSAMATNFASFKPGTCDWRDSLVRRPDGV